MFCLRLVKIQVYINFGSAFTNKFRNIIGLAPAFMHLFAFSDYIELLYNQIFLEALTGAFPWPKFQNQKKKNII